MVKPTKATLLLPISLDQRISTNYGAGAHFLAYGSVRLDTPTVRHHLHRVTILDPIHKEGVGSRRLGHASELGKDFTCSQQLQNNNLLILEIPALLDSEHRSYYRHVI